MPDATGTDAHGVDPDDDELDLIQRSGVVLRVGRLSLSAGTGSYRVKQSMVRVARALGIERHEAHVTLTEITTTSRRGRSFRTEVTEIRRVGVDARRLAALEELATSVERAGTTSVEHVTEVLDTIERRPLLYGRWLNALWSAIACAAFAFLSGAGAVEMVGVFLAAGAGQLARRAMLHRGLNQFGVTMLVAALSCLVYLGFVDTLHGAGVTETHHEAGYVASVLFLVPGFPLVTGGLDIAKMDFSAAVARLSYAAAVLASAALSVWGVSALVGLSPDLPVAPDLPTALEWALRFVASFAGVLGFALMFNSPWRMAVGAAGVGMVANVVRLLLDEHGVAPQGAAFFAAVLVGLLTAVVAPALRVPRITVSVPAVVIMVPGVLAYRAVFHLSDGDMTDALSFGAQATLVIVALAIGLSVSRMLTDPLWRYER